MEKYILSCCSTADLTKEHFEAIDVKYICFHYELDGVEYPDDLGQTIGFEDFTGEWRRALTRRPHRSMQMSLRRILSRFAGGI